MRKGKSNKGSKNPAAERSLKEAEFREIYDEYFERLISYALVITNSGEMAKDVVSEVFFYLWNTDKNLSTIRELKSYLFTSVKNQAVRAISKDPVSFESFNYQQATKAIENINPEDLMIGMELEDFVSNAVSSLPPHCQLVFKMIRLQNLSYKEVSAELDISTDTVKHHLSTALKKIRQKLEKHFTDPKLPK